MNNSFLERRPVLMIPADIPSLIMVYWAKGQTLEAGPHLKMKRLDNVGNDPEVAIKKYLLNFELTDEHAHELARKLWNIIDSGMRYADGVLLSVEAKVAGTSWLKAGNIKQQIHVTKPLFFNVTFKFLHHLDDKGNMLPATNKDPASVGGWISYLNWIFGAQANVWFDVDKVVPVKINHMLGPVNDKVVENYLAKEKDEGADVTVFLVGEVYLAAGLTYENLNLIVVNDRR